MFPAIVNVSSDTGKGMEIFLFVFLPAAVGLLVVWLAHQYTIAREDRSHRKAKIEELYVAGRKAIAYCSRVALEFLPAAQGHKLASDVAKTLAETIGKEYAAGDHATVRVEMLVDLYFPNLKQWSNGLIGHELAVRRVMNDHVDLQAGENHPGNVAIETVQRALAAYHQYAMDLTKHLQAEYLSISGSRPTWKRLFRIKPAAVH